MEGERDTYKTIAFASNETLIKEKGSKFYGYAYPVSSEEEIRERIDHLKKEHHSARHWCYAWVLGKEYERYRANDDGEPSNSAGAPIHGQIQSFDLTNVLIVVVRYFGGTKLGVGGLIQAYRSSARLALEASKIITRTINDEFVIQFPYSEMNTVMRIVKSEAVEILEQKMELDCEFQISVRKKEADRVKNLFKVQPKIDIQKA
ncbi:YigZ family protein [Aureitalea sp. L0-47]|uniref:IMPACT family protein n=1 Tax=Aureitalea sp. L0-47 TaxID=2816962 RepID=UPI0022376FE1|nr:YigZ family protein [Aureitalea sp. L0-47]MCW5519659.1 YigZ family protein [Aureitalea sp. L0-47]